MSGNTIEKLLQSTGMQIVLLIFTCGLLLGPAGSALSATISGTVSLPDLETAPEGGIDITIWIEDVNSGDRIYPSVTINEGQHEAPYNVTIQDDTNASWKISYGYDSGSDYLNEGYYSSLGTTWDDDAATLLPGGQNQNYPNINLVLLTGKTISGTVSLPDGDSIPSGGLHVNVYLRTASGVGYGYGSGGTSKWHSQTAVFITSSDPHPQYTFRVPDDAGILFEASYTLWGSDYLYYGYYQDPTHTTWYPSNASRLQGGQNHTNVDLTLIPVKRVSGTLSLPAGQTAPDNMCFQIRAKADQGIMTGWARIDSNESQYDYTISIPEDNSINWTISYDELASCDFWGPPTDYSYWGAGYYKAGIPGNTVLHEVDAEPLNGGQNHTNIDMTVLEGKMLTGTVSLPDNQQATHDIKIFIRAEISDSTNHAQMEEGFGYGYGTPMTYAENSVYRAITIRQGHKSTMYTLTISPETNITWKISYNCLEGCDNYDSTGFFNTSGTVANVSQASPLAGGTDHNNIDLTLLKKKGMLSFPVRSKDGQVSIISM